MKKRLVIIGFIFCFLFSFVACKSEGNVDVVSEVSDSEADVVSEEVVEEESVSEDEEEVYISDFEPQVIFDQEEIVITAKEYYADIDEFFEIKKISQTLATGPVIEFEFVNNSEYLIELYMDNLFIDGICYTDARWNWIFLDEKTLINNDGNVCVDVGETVTVCMDWGQWTYYCDGMKDTMDVSIGLHIRYKCDNIYKEYHTDRVAFNTIYPDNNSDKVQFDYNNIIYENNDVKLYLVSAIVEEGHDKEDTQDDDLSCVFLAESKIYEQPAEGNDALYFGVKGESATGGTLCYLVEQEMINNNWAPITGKAFLTVDERNISWNDLLNHGMFLVNYEENWIISTYEEFDFGVIEKGTIEIPISEFVYIERE